MYMFLRGNKCRHALWARSRIKRYIYELYVTVANGK